MASLLPRSLPVIRSLPRFCATCQEIRHWQATTSNYERVRGILGRDNCDVCQVFSDCYRHFFPEYYSASNLKTDFTTGNGRLVLMCPKEEKLPSDRDILFYRNPDIPCPWSIFPATKQTSVEAITTGSIDRAKHWIQKCDTHHNCQPARDHRLPTRVLHLGARNSDIRLIETGGKVARYACLSHCWGTEPAKILKTTGKNYQDHMRSIPWSRIPRTFRDAINVTRALGIAYLWIDSICIVQDSPEDWAKEAALMHSVYKYSYITIAAASATGPDGGLYLRQHGNGYQKSITSPTGDQFTVTACKHWQHFAYRDDLEISSEKWPLMGRAWVFQERLLSPRFIHFAWSEMMWECKEDTWCECGDGESKSLKQDYHETFISTTQEEVTEAWRQVVTCYSSLKISFEQDKLPALSGLAAQAAAARPGAQYLAGIWSDSLELDLLWRVDSPSVRKGRRPVEWRAPTWSWASLETPVKFPRERVIIKSFQTIQGQTTPATVDAWGQVTQGSLTITGMLFPARVWLEIYNTHIIIDDRTSIFSCESTERFYDSEDETILFLDFSHESLYLAEILRDSTVSCLRVARSRGDGYECEHTLVLCCRYGSTKYERIGIIEHSSGSDDEEEMAEFWASDDHPFAQGGELKTIEII